MTERRRWPVLEPAPSWRDRTAAEHARGLELACEAALQLLVEAPDRIARLERADPVPASTRALLRRLAAQG